MAKEFVIPSRFTINDQFSTPFAKMTAMAGESVDKMAIKASRLSSFVKNNSESFRTMGRNATIAGGVILGSMGAMANEAVKFEDKLSDVAKTTGLQGRALDSYGESLLKMSENTRTSIADLQVIGEMGGQMGVAEKHLVSFTEAADKFGVALGSDFGSLDEAVTQVSKINSLFKDTRDLDPAENITRVGSAINHLGGIGAATSANMTDFMLRIGAMPDALKPTLTSTSALGAFLEESGIDAQVASSGFSNFTKIAATSLGKMSKVMGITAKEANDLFNSDTTAFAAKFAQSTKSMSATDLAMMFKDLGMNSLEVQKVIGALSNDTIDAATGMSRMAELTNEANKAFSDGTSLLNEFNTKNSTTAAEMAKAKNTIQSMAITIGQQLLPIIADLMSWLSPMVKSFAEWVRENKPLVSTLAKVAAVVGGVLVVLGPLLYAIGSVHTVVASARKALMIGSVAMKAFGASTTLALGPIGLLIAAIGVAVLAYKGFNEWTKKAASTEQLATNVKKRALEATIDQRVESKLLFEELKRSKAGTDQYNSALSKLDSILPGITDKYRNQKGEITDLIGLEKEYTKTLIERAKQEAAAELTKETLKAAMEREENGPSGWDKAIAILSNPLAMNLFESGREAVAKDAQANQKKNVDILYQEADRYAAMSVPSNERVVSAEQAFAGIEKQQSEILLKIDNAGAVSTVDLSGGQSFSMNVKPALGSTVK